MEVTIETIARTWTQKLDHVFMYLPEVDRRALSQKTAILDIGTDANGSRICALQRRGKRRGKSCGQ